MTAQCNGKEGRQLVLATGCAVTSAFTITPLRQVGQVGEVTDERSRHRSDVGRWSANLAFVEAQEAQ